MLTIHFKGEVKKKEESLQQHACKRKEFKHVYKSFLMTVCKSKISTQHPLLVTSDRLFLLHFICHSDDPETQFSAACLN